ncbi:MAG: ABC transporter permease [Lachnospira sp.]|nr:ABC transporter permease [Lachnospira sp.]
MKPISAWYFIKENKLRCGLLAFMFVLTYLAYIGGLYVTNIQTGFDYHIESMRKYAIIYPRASDSNFVDFKNAVKELEANNDIKLIKQGVISSINIDSIMGYSNMYESFAFNSVEDFKTFCEIRDVKCDFDGLKSGHVIMSRMAANNRGLELGETLVEEEDDNIYHKYTLGAITDEEGYWTYFINDDENLTSIIISVGMSDDEFAAYTEEIAGKYDVSVTDRKRFAEDIKIQLNGLNLIYAFIVILVAVIMAVTVNAAFVGMYQHRKPEFAIYRAIGISKGQGIRKIAGELVLIDFVGMAAGGVVVMTIIYLLNELVLYNKGLWLDYYHPFALAGIVVCNLAVLVPMILTGSRQFLKADICEY